MQFEYLITLLNCIFQDGVGNQGYMGSIENDISRDAPVKLLSGKRTYVQPPVDHDHLDLTDITTLGCLVREPQKKKQIVGVL